MKKIFPPLDFQEITTYSIQERHSLVQVDTFARAWKKGQTVSNFMTSLPDILAGRHFREIVRAVVMAVRNEKPVVFAMGAHVMKCGLSPIIIDLMERGIVSAIALNGAGIIHDFEVASTGQTSEDVAKTLPTGEFGMCRETGQFLNDAINRGAEQNRGIGESVGQALIEADFQYLEYSVVAAGYRLGVPVTVHVAIGADIIHPHPNASGAAIGAGSHQDFKRFCGVMSQLEGGVYCNIGSAVMLPEVFLKAISTVRNLGYTVNHFSTVNMDVIRHYRPMQNVTTRPTSEGGTGYTLIGHHEIQIPLLAAAIIESMNNENENEQ